MLVVGEHVDERGFPYIGASDKGEFRFVRSRALLVFGAAFQVGGGLDGHNQMFKILIFNSFENKTLRFFPLFFMQWRKTMLQRCLYKLP